MFKVPESTFADLQKLKSCSREERRLWQKIGLWLTCEVGKRHAM